MQKLDFYKYKKWGTITAFILCIVLALVYIYRDDIFQTIQNYASLESWLAQPDLGVDPYTLTAKGDVFVVVPSVYRGGKHWNLPSDDLKRKNKLQRIVRPNYVAPYGEAGRLFAPFYRQASLYAFMTNREDAQQAQDFAYQDVKRAFDVFIRQSPPERPIVLVGHNQGASHVQRLLIDYFQGPLKTRLAVAYVIAPARLHLGGVAAEGLDPDMTPAPMTKQSGAQCQNGLLLVDKPRSKSLHRPRQVGAKFRTLPSNLFYEDLKQDAKRRVQNLLDSNILPERAGALLDDFELQEIKDSPVTPPEDENR